MNISMLINISKHKDYVNKYNMYLDIKLNSK